MRAPHLRRPPPTAKPAGYKPVDRHLADGQYARPARGGAEHDRGPLRRGGRLALNVFSAFEDTAVSQALADALDRHVGPGASAVKRAEHALADTACKRRGDWGRRSAKAPT